MIKAYTFENKHVLVRVMNKKTQIVNVFTQRILQESRSCK